MKMKIGFSYSRCLRDILNGTVDLDDVLLIVGNTLFDPNDDENWQEIWQGYSTTTWNEFDEQDKLRLRELTIALWNEGRFHQPRKFGARFAHSRDTWFEIVPVPDNLQHPAVLDAWQRFQTVARLANAESQ